MNNVKLLETTIRDGGMGLEFAYKNHYSDKCYNAEQIHSILSSLCESHVDIIEIGAVDPYVTEIDLKFAKYHTIEELSSTLPANKKEHQLCVGFVVGPDTPLDKVPEWRPGLVDGLRLSLRYSELKKSLEYGVALAQKGYKLFLQPMITMRYSDSELDMITDYANEAGAYAVYFVDTYGHMTEEDVSRLFFHYDKRLEKGIRIGFHPHNNMNLAFSNTRFFLNIESERNVIIDACCTGLGQGAGNLQSELIMPYLIKEYGKEYFDYDSLLDICDLVDSQLNEHNVWGYSVNMLLPALYKSAYKYVPILRYKYKLSYREINKLLKVMPYDMRMRYTDQNVKDLVEKYL